MGIAVSTERPGAFNRKGITIMATTTDTDIRRETIAQGMLAEIREMQKTPMLPWKGKDFLLPDVRTFGELHDYFDANVGWQIEEFDGDYWFTDEGNDLYLAIQNRVHEMLQNGEQPAYLECLLAAEINIRCHNHEFAR